MDKRKTILFVDDERAVLRSLYRLFRERDYDIFLADNGDEALRIFANKDVDLVVADMRMPNMNGHQLLRKVKEQYPLVMRLILSGYSQEQEIFKSLLDGSARMYVLKPWDNETMVRIVDNIFNIRDILGQTELLSAIHRMSKLPTLPAIYERFCKMIDRDAEAREIAGMIELDHATAAQVLHMANSAFFGLKTGSVQHAIVYLGLRVIKDIILASTILDANGFRDRRALERKELLWRHASLCNRMTAMLAQRLLHKKLPDEWASAGLLHDVGKVILLKEFGEDYLNFLANTEVLDGQELQLLETNAFGVSHEALGGYLLNLWGLPYPIVEACMFHRNPLEAPVINRELVCLVHLANYYSWQKIMPSGKVYLDERVFAELRIQQGECERIVAEISP